MCLIVGVGCKIYRVLILMLAVRPSSGITTRAIVSNNRQTASVSERDKVSAAARLTLMILVTKRAITAVQVAPNLTVGHAHWNLK